ncbi:hypothetical protein Tco_1438141 [Tanacetum coccineum]
MSPNFVATPLPQDDVPSPVSGSLTPIFGAAKSTLDTPLFSQESSTTALLPCASNNTIDDQLIYVVPSEVNLFMNPFSASTIEIGESSQARYVDPSDEHTFHQPHPHNKKWTRDHPLHQIIGHPANPLADFFTKALSEETFLRINDEDSLKIRIKSDRQDDEMELIRGWSRFTLASEEIRIEDED